MTDKQKTLTNCTKCGGELAAIREFVTDGTGWRQTCEIEIEPEEPNTALVMWSFAASERVDVDDVTPGEWVECLKCGQKQSHLNIN